MDKKKILVAEDDASLLRVLQYQLEQRGYEVLTAEDGRRALQIFELYGIDLVITDLQMPEMDGLELLERIRTLSPDAIVVMITGHGTVDSAVEAMRKGAFDYITKPVHPQELALTVEKALTLRHLLDENRNLRQVVEESFRRDEILGNSPAMKRLFELIAQVSRTDATVLITGESGTGKELLARAIHRNSARQGKPFIPVNCGAIPEALLESELFGYKRGAFTGAQTDRAGKFEAAHRGTLFLDEVAELQPSLQVKLLRVLQDGKIDKLGVPEPLPVDVRIVAATHRDLRHLAEEGRFREDLFYRLNVVPIRVPTLRERREDIPALAHHFLKQYGGRHQKPNLKLSREVFAAFDRYTWPGNVRELENLLERLVIMARDDVVCVDDLPPELFHPAPAEVGPVVRIPEGGLDLVGVEKMLIEKALEINHGNQSRAARFLNISRNTLLYRMQKFGLAREKGSARKPESESKVTV
ncbi:MAG: sigma-54-dependent Fis family transcriptional regulator [Acidobacteria bacterium]|nr:sigma-54-dependent Fis family transcriptional regulator [Acidobacteriota bacterium]